MFLRGPVKSACVRRPMERAVMMREERKGCPGKQIQDASMGLCGGTLRLGADPLAVAVEEEGDGDLHHRVSDLVTLQR